MGDTSWVHLKERQSQGLPRFWMWLVVPVLVAGCAVAPKPDPKQAEDPFACQAAAADEAWTGNWLGVNQRKGVAGELRVQMVLRQDGTMEYVEQLQRSGKPAQALNESGCWHRKGTTLVMRTTHSNAVPVEQGDPIYINEYAVRISDGRLALNGPEGPLSLRRMPDDYRLPLF